LPRHLPGAGMFDFQRAPSHRYCDRCGRIFQCK
jgi:hypothetical protein